MKLSILALAATLAVVNAVDCDVQKLTPLLADPSIATCTTDSSFSFTALTKPTAETLPKLCASAACKKVLAAVTALGLGDCTLAGIKLESGLVTPIKTACAGATSSASNSSTTTSAANSTSATKSGSSAGTATVGTTTAPTTSSTSSSTGSGMSSDSTVSIPATATTPAPTTAKSGASSVAIATGAVVVAIAAAFF